MMEGAEKRMENEWERTAWAVARTLEAWSSGKRIDHWKLLGKERPKPKAAPATAKDFAKFDELIGAAPAAPAGVQSVAERAAELAKLQRQVNDLAKRGLLPE